MKGTQEKSAKANQPFGLREKALRKHHLSKTKVTTSKRIWRVSGKFLESFAKWTWVRESLVFGSPFGILKISAGNFWARLGGLLFFEERLYIFRKKGLLAAPRTSPHKRWCLFPTNLLGQYSSFRGSFRSLPRAKRSLPRTSAAHGLQDLLPRVLAQKGKSS